MWVFWFFTILICGGILLGIIATIAEKAEDIISDRKTDHQINNYKSKLNEVVQMQSDKIEIEQKKQKQEELRLSKLTDEEIEQEEQAIFTNRIELAEKYQEIEIERRIRAEIEEEIFNQEQKDYEDKIRARIKSEYSISN